MTSSFSNSLSTASREETYYTILEINCAATSQEIKDAYKRLAIRQHPDKNLGDEAKACADFQKVCFLPKLFFTNTLLFNI